MTTPPDEAAEKGQGEVVRGASGAVDEAALDQAADKQIDARDVAELWQGASVVTEAMRRTNGDEAEARIRDALIAAGQPVVAIGERAALDLGLRFGGIDVSPAPNGKDSIGAAIELFGYGPVGAPGTFAAAGTITSALKSTNLPTCGYSGLMLPILEDDLLAQRWSEGRLTVHGLLAYSTVCGTGLDAVPLPGDVGENELAALIVDVATVALRVRKPLSARLMPAPGTHSGDRTRFSSPYLVNSRVWSIAGPMPHRS